jgi:hypothetical protein
MELSVAGFQEGEAISASKNNRIFERYGPSEQKK